PLITSVVLANTRHLHVGGVRHLQNSEAPLSGHSISLSIGSEDLALGIEGFKQLNGIVDILFVNADEGRSLAKVDNLQQVLDVLSTVFPFVVLTDGERGAFAIHNGETHFHPALASTVVDATGAGDSFVAGFLLAYRQTASIDAALKLASACGALAVTMVGATTHIPNRETLEKLLEANA
ncbi:MAG: carbohydrate kinase family protein, partial [Woeseia sp.]